MFDKRIIKKFFLENYDLNNIVNINCDFLVLDQNEKRGNLIMASLLDAPAKLDKIRADYLKNTLGQMIVVDKDGQKNILPYYINNGAVDFRDISLNFIKTKQKDLSHLLISRKSNSPYIIKFSEEDSLIDLMMNKLINTYFIPCNEEMLQEALNNEPNILKEMLIVCNNEELEHIEVYRFEKEIFIQTINKISKAKGEVPDPIFEKFLGDFTGYINYFKEDILDNLYGKIDEFFDANNVPEYVTTFPYPLPNEDMRKVLNVISQSAYKKDIFDLEYKESIAVYEKYKKMDKLGKIKRTDTFNPNWSRQYNCWTAAMKILEQEKFCYMSLVMGAGRL